MAANVPRAVGAFIPIPVILVVGLILGVVANLFLPFPLLPGGWFRPVGVVPLAVGAWLFFSARAAFRQHNTPLMPWKPSSGVVKDGPYRFTRNPIYLAFGMWCLGVSFVFNSGYVLIVLVAVVVLFDRVQIPREERYLQEMFGEEYARYSAKVRRWI